MLSKLNSLYPSNTTSLDPLPGQISKLAVLEAMAEEAGTEQDDHGQNDPTPNLISGEWVMHMTRRGREELGFSEKQRKVQKNMTAAFNHI